jgi:hypothetical protein
MKAIAWQVLATCLHAGFMPDPEEEGDMFLCNVG